MSRRTLFAVLAILLLGAGLAWYLDRTRSETSDAASGIPAAELETLDRMLAGSDEISLSRIDSRAIRVLVAKDGGELDMERAEAIAPLLREHLRALRGNLEEARAAASSGASLSERRRFHIFAAQAHGKFQAAIGKIVPRETALAIYKAYPAMLPPAPGKEIPK